MKLSNIFAAVFFLLFASVVESSNLRGGSSAAVQQEQEQPQQQAVVVDPLQSMLAVVRDLVMPASPVSTNSTADDIIESTFEALAEYLDAQEEQEQQQQQNEGTITTTEIVAEQ